MAKLSKLDRMGVSGSALSDEGLEDAKEAIQNVLEHLDTFEEKRAEAIENFQTAVSNHEEREWEDRDSALDEAQGALDEMSSALDEIEMQSEWVTLPDGRLEMLRKTIEEVREHLGVLI
jgi:chromosome segregation ATPase